MQSPSPESTTERWWLGAALALAPASYLAAQGVLAAMPREGSLFATLAAHSGLWLASHVLLTAWLVLLVPSLAALGTLLGRDGWPYRVIGVTLAALGLVVNGLITGVDFVLGAIAPLDATLTASVHETISATVLAPLDLLDTALPLGLLVLTLGLFRRRTAPRWAVLLLLAALAVPNTPELRLAAAAMQLLAFVCLAVLFSRQRRQPSAISAPIAHPVAGVVLAIAIMLPGAFFSIERIGFAVLVVLTLGVGAAWDWRTSRGVSVGQAASVPKRHAN